jgi:predicted O-methyltransferase YrrM
MPETKSKLWAQVDHYLADLFAPADDALAAALDANHKADLPAIDVPPLLGKFLALLIQISGTKRVLEIGTLGGYSTTWMARAIPADGKVITLELEQHHAEIARANLTRAGVIDHVEIRLGPAIESLQALHQSSAEPFDLIFIDADKKSLPEYLDWSLKLAHKGTLLVADNVIRDGKIIKTKSSDQNVQGARSFLELVAANPRLNATAFQTVDRKGYDGFAMAVVTS